MTVAIVRWSPSGVTLQASTATWTALQDALAAQGSYGPATVIAAALRVAGPFQRTIRVETTTAYAAIIIAAARLG